MKIGYCPNGQVAESTELPSIMPLQPLRIEWLARFLKLYESVRTALRASKGKIGTAD